MAVNIQQLQKDGVYEGKAPLAALISDLDQIAKLAHDIAARKKTQAWIGALIALGGVLGWAVCSIAGLDSMEWIAILAILGGVAWMFYSLATKGKLLHHLKRVGTGRERLTMIQPDAKAEKAFSLRLILVPQPKQISKGAWHGKKNGQQEFTEESWFALEGPLLDGSVLSDEISELLRKRIFSNPRGKRKTKTRSTYVVSVRFTYPPERYGDARAASEALKEEIGMRRAGTRSSVRVTEKAVAMKAKIASEDEIPHTAGMLSVGAYRILNLARRIQERKGASAQ